MFKKFVIVIAITLNLMIWTPVNADDIVFCSERTFSSIMNELQATNKELPKYLKSKYGVSDYKKAKEFKFKVCGALVYDCYNVRNDKYFVRNIPHVNKWGEFYFGMLWNDRASAIVHSISWCESSYRPDIVSGDGGIGLFQITPNVINDKTIKKSQLFDMEYNTMYGTAHLSKFYKGAKDKFGKYNQNGNQDFIWYLTLRSYNGGTKQLQNIFERSDDPLKYIFGGDYISASKISGRWVCYELVNVSYPLKVYKTANTLIKKVF